MCGLYLEGLKLEVVFCLQVDGPITPGGGGAAYRWRFTVCGKENK